MDIKAYYRLSRNIFRTLTIDFFKHICFHLPASRYLLCNNNLFFPIKTLYLISTYLYEHVQKALD